MSCLSCCNNDGNNRGNHVQLPQHEAEQPRNVDRVDHTARALRSAIGNTIPTSPLAPMIIVSQVLQTNRNNPQQPPYFEAQVIPISTRTLIVDEIRQQVGKIIPTNPIAPFIVVGYILASIYQQRRSSRIFLN